MPRIHNTVENEIREIKPLISFFNPVPNLRVDIDLSSKTGNSNLSVFLFIRGALDGLEFHVDKMTFFVHCLNLNQSPIEFVFRSTKRP
jgi:hypothetical protein